MPSNAATKISTIFRDRVITELIYLLISAAMVSMMFRRLIWIHFFNTFWQFVCITSFYLSLNAILTSHFSNITYFRQQQQQNKPMKYYEILPTHTETPRNTTRKIANLYIEFNCHFLTLQKKIPLLLNRSVGSKTSISASSALKHTSHESITLIKQHTARCENFRFRVVSHETFKCYIDQLKSDKAAGFDGLKAKFLKLSDNKYISFMCDVLNKCVYTNVFPSSMKLAEISPIYKKKKTTTFARKIIDL